MFHPPTQRAVARHRSGAPIVGVLLLAMAWSPVPASGTGIHDERPVPVRHAPLGGRGGVFDSRRVTSAGVPNARILNARALLARNLGSQGIMAIDPLTHTPRMVAKLDGFLTGTSGHSARSIAMSYVQSNLAAFGLTPKDLTTLRFDHDYVDIDGGHHLSWVQGSGSLIEFDNGLKANVTADGRLINVSGSPVHGLRTSGARAVVTASTAFTAARRAGGARVTTPSSRDQAGLVLFHTGRGTRLAWRTTTFIDSGQIDLSVVDARTGAVLWRANQVRADSPGTGLAWESYPSDQVPLGGGAQQPVTFGVSSTTKLIGNLAHVYSDVNDDDRPGPADEIPASDPLAVPAEWNYPFDHQFTTNNVNQNCTTAIECSWNRQVRQSWTTNRRQNAVQLFYYLNKYHDHLQAAPIGFTEAAGNFQQTNTPGNGAGGDAVQGQILDGANTNNGLPDPFHYNNANMYTPPDGQKPIMQMYLFRRDPSAPGYPSANAGDDATVVYHEYTHGLSSRLVTYPNGTSALNTWQSGAMGEAWSDWYALDFMVTQGYQVDGAGADMLVAPHITGGEGIRYEAADCPVGPTAPDCHGHARSGPGGFTYGDFGKIFGRPEVHSDGEIWLQTLWQLRDALGSSDTECLVTRAMELSPPDPSFLDMRNAILQADLSACGQTDDQATIWNVFRNRGMGFFASALNGDDVTPTQNFQGPPTCPATCSPVVGRITNAVTHLPLAGVLVGFGGHLSGAAATSAFPGTDLLDRTDANGRFRIEDVPHHRYADLVVTKGSYEPLVLHGLLVNGIEHVLRRIYRDWASTEGGAHVVKATPPNYSVFGCGPANAFDLSSENGWGSDAPNSRFGSNVTGPRSVVVRLPKPVNIVSFGFDPHAACGDPLNASVRAFTIQTRTLTGPWTTAFSRAVALRVGRLNRLIPHGGRDASSSSASRC